MAVLKHVEHLPDASPSRHPRDRHLDSVGFWAAVSTAILSVAWLASVAVQVSVAPVPRWRGVSDYAGQFSEWHLLPLYPSLLLAVAFLILLAAIHLGTSPERRVWSLSAMAVGVVYAAMASTTVSGIAYLARSSWWPQLTLAAAILSLALLIVYFSKWWLVGYPISAAFAIAAWSAPSSRS